MLALNENNQNVCIVKKLTDSSYVLEIKSSGSANGLDVGERKREKFSQVCSSSTGAIYLDQESEKEQVYDEKPFSYSRADINSQKHI